MIFKIMPKKKRKKFTKKEIAEDEVLSQIKNPDLDDLLHVIQFGKDKDKIKKVFLKTIQNKGDVRKAMKGVGYAVTTRRNPGRVTKSKTWKALIDYFFPPDELLAKEKKLFNHEDWRAVANSLDRIHKIRGSFIKKVDINIYRPKEFRTMKDDQLREIVEGDFEEVERPKGEKGSSKDDGEGESEEGTSESRTVTEAIDRLH